MAFLRDSQTRFFTGFIVENFNYTRRVKQSRINFFTEIMFGIAYVVHILTYFCDTFSLKACNDKFDAVKTPLCVILRGVLYFVLYEFTYTARLAR